MRTCHGTAVIIATVERRRDRNETTAARWSSYSELPALVVLERMLVPALAVGVDGTILFANQAFAEMLGSTADAIRSLNFGRFFTRCRPTDPLFRSCETMRVWSSS